MKKKTSRKTEKLAADPLSVAIPPATDPSPEPSDKTSNPHFEDRPDLQQSSEKTLYLKLDADGNPQWSRMTPKSLETWKSIFQHPATSSQFSTEALPPEDKGAKSADATQVLNWLATGQGLIFSRITGLPVQDALEICTWTNDERESLEPRAARLMNKYGGDVFAKYGDEIFFASTLGMGVLRRFRACQSAAHKLEPEPLARSADENKKSEEQLVN